MSNSLLFRIDNSDGSGLGHFVRSLEIALALKLLGVRIYFVLDNTWPRDFAALKPFEDDLIVLSNLDQADEFASISRFIQKYNIANIFVDSYKTTIQWFDGFHNLGIKIFLLDDCNQSASPYIVKIPYGLRFYGTRHDPQISLGEQAIANVVLSDSEILPLNEYKKSKYVRIFVYLGTNPFKDVARKVFLSLLKCISHSKIFVEFIAIRSEIVNEKFIAYLLGDFDELGNVIFELVDFSSNFDQLISNVDLVVGASNTSLYYTSIHKIPHITFPLNPSQKNDDFQLEQLGHYFNLNSLADFDDARFDSFFIFMVENRRKLKILFKEATARPDSRGANRVANFLFSQLSGQRVPELSFTQDAITAKKTEMGFKVRRAENKDVNLILESRNLEATRKFMLNRSLISKPEHYAWWFSNNRENFIVCNREIPSIYIWHELVQINRGTFLIGGWTPLTEGVHLSLVLEALNWQISSTSLKHPFIQWIAAVHSDNLATHFLVNRIGFKPSEPGSATYIAAQTFFLDGMESEEFVLYSS